MNFGVCFFLFFLCRRRHVVCIRVDHGVDKVAYMTKIFLLCLTNGKIPREWKTAQPFFGIVIRMFVCVCYYKRKCRKEYFLKITQTKFKDIEKLIKFSRVFRVSVWVLYIYIFKNGSIFFYENTYSALLADQCIYAGRLKLVNELFFHTSEVWRQFPRKGCNIICHIMRRKYEIKRRSYWIR